MCVSSRKLAVEEERERERDFCDVGRPLCKDCHGSAELST